MAKFKCFERVEVWHVDKRYEIHSQPAILIDIDDISYCEEATICADDADTELFEMYKFERGDRRALELKGTYVYAVTKGKEISFFVPVGIYDMEKRLSE